MYVKKSSGTSGNVRLILKKLKVLPHNLGASRMSQGYYSHPVNIQPCKF